MKNFRLLLLLFSLIISSTSVYAQKPVLEGNWKIKSFKDSGKMIDLGSKETHVEISKSNAMTIHVGCNHISSKIEFITADKIKPFELTATRKSCSEYLEGLESSLRYALEQTNSIRKNGTKVEFYKDNDLLIVLERKVESVKKKGK
jgi:heat shock protein HslJ